MKLGTRLTLFGIAAVVSTAVLIMVAVSWQTTTIIGAATGELRGLAESDLKNICLGAYNVAQCQDKTMDTSGGRKNTETLRDTIIDTPVGSSGYIFVLDGKGNYVVSKGGKRDGECIWDAKDASGRYFIREMVQKATALGTKEVFTYRYTWQNEGDPAPRWKMAAVMYYEPWGWVIGASTYEDELMKLGSRVDSARSRMLMTASGVSLLVCLVTTIVFLSFASGVGRRLDSITRAANALAEGDISLAERLMGTD